MKVRLDLWHSPSLNLIPPTTCFGFGCDRVYQPWWKSSTHQKAAEAPGQVLGSDVWRQPVRQGGRPRT